DPTLWHASASDDVTAHMRRDPDGSLCMDYDFGAVSGYAVLRRNLPLDLAANYSFRLRVKGAGPANDLQFKLLDASGENVWWATRRRFALHATPTELRFKRRHISFAWGPTHDRELRHAAQIEFVMAAAAGGHGSLCLQQLVLDESPIAVPAVPPRVTASAAIGADTPARVLDQRRDTAWQAP